MNIENCLIYYFNGIRVVPHFSQSVNQKEFIGREFDKPLKGGICDILLPLMITLDKVVLIKKKRSITFLHKSRLMFIIIFRFGKGWHGRHPTKVLRGNGEKEWWRIWGGWGGGGGGFSLIIFHLWGAKINLF